MSAPTRPKVEIARLGDEIYRRDIRAKLEADHHGDVVAIDVATGTWAVGDNVIAATDRLREKYTGAVDVWLLRVGYRVVASIGGGSLRRAE